MVYVNVSFYCLGSSPRVMFQNGFAMPWKLQASTSLPVAHHFRDCLLTPKQKYSCWCDLMFPNGIIDFCITRRHDFFFIYLKWLNISSICFVADMLLELDQI